MSQCLEDIIYIYNPVCHALQSGPPRQRKTPGSAKGSSRRMKKRHPWSDNDEKSDSDVDDSEQLVIPRDLASRRASGVCSSFPPFAVIQLFFPF